MRPVARSALSTLRPVAVSRICRRVLPVGPSAKGCVVMAKERGKSTREAVRAFATAAASPRARAPEQLRWKRGAEIRMLYDGDCPLCMREVNMLRKRDEGVGKIDFVDITSPEFVAEANAGVSYEQAMGEIHAILPDGSVVKNVDVFRRLYEAVGLGWVYAITKVQPIGKAADWVYGIWAKYRLPITGRPDLQTVMAEKKSCKIR